MQTCPSSSLWCASFPFCLSVGLHEHRRYARVNLLWEHRGKTHTCSSKSSFSSISSRKLSTLLWSLTYLKSFENCCLIILVLSHFLPYMGKKLFHSIWSMYPNSIISPEGLTLFWEIYNATSTLTWKTQCFIFARLKIS